MSHLTAAMSIMIGSVIVQTLVLALETAQTGRREAQPAGGLHGGALDGASGPTPLAADGAMTSAFVEFAYVYSAWPNDFNKQGLLKDSPWWTTGYLSTSVRVLVSPHRVSPEDVEG